MLDRFPAAAAAAAAAIASECDWDDAAAAANKLGMLKLVVAEGVDDELGVVVDDEDEDVFSLAGLLVELEDPFEEEAAEAAAIRPFTVGRPFWPDDTYGSSNFL